MIVIGVVAHNQRRKQAEKLAEQVGASVCLFDDGTLKCEGNHLEVLRLLHCYDADWVVVLEDDAAPQPGFGIDVRAALRNPPAPVIGLYLGTGNPSGEPQRQIKAAVDAAKAQGAAWLLADCLIGSVGYAVRGSHIADMLDFITGRDEELPLRISRWAQARGHFIGYTQPSLVDHRDDEPIGRPWRGPHFLPRKAWNYGTRENWDTPAVRIGHCPVWSAHG